MPIHPPDRNQIVQLIRRWGGLTTDAILDPSTQIFMIPEVEGLIGYRILSGCAVVFGDPVCAPRDIPSLTQAFHRFCAAQKMPVIYLISSESFAKWSINQTCKAIVQFGEELYIDPQNDPRERQGTHASLIRRKVRHAIHEETVVKEHAAGDLSLEQSMLQTARSWLQARKGPQIHISRVRLFEDTHGKRWFYAMQRGRMVGMIVLNHLQARNGWLINHLMITPDAPHGTSELLVISALEALKREGCTYATFGAVPEMRLGEISGLSKMSTWMTRLIYRTAYHVFHLKGHKMFWGKFFPETLPSYLLFSRPQIGYQEIRALMEAMNVTIR